MLSPRFIIGVLIAVYAVYLILVARYRARVTAHRAVTLKICGYELLICACGLISALVPGGGALAWVLRIAALAVIVPALGLLVPILLHMHDRPAAPAAYAVVPGMALERGRPNRDLVFRVDAAAAYAGAHPGARLIVTGGNAGGGRPEAAVMRDMLVERGIPPDDIMVEDQAEDTDGNFAYVARMIDPSKPIALITSGYHMLRALSAARAAGFSRMEGWSAKCDPKMLPANLLWEVVCGLDRLTRRLKT